MQSSRYTSLALLPPGGGLRFAGAPKTAPPEHQIPLSSFSPEAELMTYSRRQNKRRWSFRDFTDSAIEERCTRCGELRPRELFNRHRHTHDGLGSYCRDCRCKYRSDR
jgi:hypothetical protein